jgi:hypothetical protein
MKKLITAVALVMLSAVPSLAQSQAAPGSRYAWEQAENPASFVYQVETDGAAPVGLTKTCTTVVPYSCEAPIQALTPGGHKTRIRATVLVNGSPLVGAYSTVLDFIMIAIPTAPFNLKIVKFGFEWLYKVAYAV